MSFNAHGSEGPACTDDGSISCGDNGICRQIADEGYVCLCKSGYAQNVSDILNQCQPISFCEYATSMNITVCLHGGTCSDMPVDDPSRFNCSCPQYYSGTQCEDFQDPCATAEPLCLNGGECSYQPFQKEGYVCLCAAGFSGTNCENILKFGLTGQGVQLSSAELVASWATVMVLVLLFVFCCATATFQWCSMRWTQSITSIRNQALGIPTIGGDKGDKKD